MSVSHRLRIPVVALLPLAAAGCSDDPLGHFADVFDLDTQVSDTDPDTGGAGDAGGGGTDTAAPDGGDDAAGDTDPDATAGDTGEDAPLADVDDDATTDGGGDTGGGDTSTGDASTGDTDPGDVAPTDAGDADVDPTDADPADARDADPADVGADVDPADTGLDADAGASDTGDDGGGVVLPPDIEALLRSFCELSLSCTEFPFYESLDDCVDFRAIFFDDLVAYYGDDCAAAYADYMTCVSELECEDYYYAYTACETTYDAFVGTCFDAT